MREGVADFCYPFFVCFSFYVSSKQITFAATIQKKHTTMKKKILSAAFCLFATTAMGQINLVSYHPVPRQMNYTPLPQFGSNPFQMHSSTRKSKCEYSVRDKEARAEFPSYSCLLCRFKTPPEAYQNKGEPSLNLFFSSSVFKRSLRT